MKPTALDTRCHRSSDAYATALAHVNGWHVENLACSGATISEGLLGSQNLGTTTAPAQLAEAKRGINIRAIFVSVGANDVGWEGELALCAKSRTCADAASTAYFQRQLHLFADNYYQLLRQLAALPGNPAVIINEYYTPFDPQEHCLDDAGLTGAKQHEILGRLDAFNAVLRNGAAAFRFVSTRPDFSGHTVCTSQPYVQGPTAAAPFHPTAAGELAMRSPTNTRFSTEAESHASGAALGASDQPATRSQADRETRAWLVVVLATVAQSHSTSGNSARSSVSASASTLRKLMAHYGSWLMAHGSWLMAHEQRQTVSGAEAAWWSVFSAPPEYERAQTLRDRVVQTAVELVSDIEVVERCGVRVMAQRGGRVAVAEAGLGLEDLAVLDQ